MYLCLFWLQKGPVVWWRSACDPTGSSTSLCVITSRPHWAERSSKNMRNHQCQIYTTSQYKCRFLNYMFMVKYKKLSDNKGNKTTTQLPFLRPVFNDETMLLWFKWTYWSNAVIRDHKQQQTSLCVAWPVEKCCPRSARWGWCNEL